MTDQEFPIVNKRTALQINDAHTDILLTSFTDKIFIVVTQYGKIEVPTTSQFLFGESTGTQSDLYTLYASSISQAICAMNPNEKRPVVLGIALKPAENMEKQRQVFHAIIDVIIANPVW
ncbi:unnamed protein product [Cunninghamella blakesleeana]